MTLTILRAAIGQRFPTLSFNLSSSVISPILGYGLSRGRLQGLSASLLVTFDCVFTLFVLSFLKVSLSRTHSQAMRYVYVWCTHIFICLHRYTQGHIYSIISIWTIFMPHLQTTEYDHVSVNWKLTLRETNKTDPMSQQCVRNHIC